MSIDDMQTLIDFYIKSNIFNKETLRMLISNLLFR